VDVPTGPSNTTVTVPALVDAPDEPTPPPWEPPRPIGPQRAPPEEAGGAQRVAGLAVAGAGVVAAAIGIGIGFNAKSIYNAANADEHCVDNHCDDYGTTRRNDAFAAAKVATILTVAGGVVAGAGIVLYLTAPRTRAPVAVKASASGVLLDARF
jgi:hypothetical protein